MKQNAYQLITCYWVFSEEALTPCFREKQYYPGGVIDRLGRMGKHMVASMSLTRTVQQAEQLELQEDATQVFNAFYEALKAVGRVQSSQPPLGRIVGRVGSGAFNMNSADVTIRVAEGASGGSTVTILATAQEGLIQQNTAGLAISRILEAL